MRVATWVKAGCMDGDDPIFEERAILITGPTASGKSAFALQLANEAVAVGRSPLIVNADSMQVYQELRILSARPSEEEEARADHRLYGYVTAAEIFNTGRWLAAVAALLDDLDDKALPIFVGGTGLYFKALTEGFAQIPAIPDAVRERYRYEMHERGPAKMHALLRRVDPLSAVELKPGDGQRILRALEVKEVTGKSILWWQKEMQKAPILPASQCRKYVVLPNRDILYSRIDTRFDAMVDYGALDEVAALAEMDLAPDLPAMKAIGVPQFSAHLRGEIDFSDAVEDAKRESRRYAKRQMTWFRNQLSDEWQRLEAAFLR